MRIGQPLPAEKLERQRQLRGWSKSDLAREAGISRQAASNACAGRPVTGPVMQAIAVAFGRTKHQVLPEVRELLEAAG
jgi:transcriptional regulator with XRE-family HTH domain